MSKKELTFEEKLSFAAGRYLGEDFGEYEDEGSDGELSAVSDEPRGGSVGWDVYLDGELLDTVQGYDGFTPEEVKQSLIDNDGFDYDIEVVKSDKVRPAPVRAEAEESDEDVVTEDEDEVVTEDAGEHTYKAFYKGKSIEVTAPSSYEAQKKAAQQFKAKKSYDVEVKLVKKDDGEEVVHTATESVRPSGLSEAFLYSAGSLLMDYNDYLSEETK